MIDSTQLDNILYQRIKQRPEFNQQILLSQIIGPNIDRVFLLADTALNQTEFAKSFFQLLLSALFQLVELIQLNFHYQKNRHYY